MWYSKEYPKRLPLLNEYRKGLGLRIAKTWAQAYVFLTEEHAPELLPADHVFPWDVPPGVAPKAVEDSEQHDDEKGPLIVSRSLDVHAGEPLLEQGGACGPPDSTAGAHAVVSTSPLFSEQPAGHAGGAKRGGTRRTHRQ